MFQERSMAKGFYSFSTVLLRALEKKKWLNQTSALSSGIFLLSMGSGWICVLDIKSKQLSIFLLLFVGEQKDLYKSLSNLSNTRGKCCQISDFYHRYPALCCFVLWNCMVDSNFQELYLLWIFTWKQETWGWNSGNKGKWHKTCSLLCGFYLV